MEAHIILEETLVEIKWTAKDACLKSSVDSLYEEYLFPLPPLAVWQLLILFKHHSGPEFASLLFSLAFTIPLSNHKISAVSI